MISLVKGEMFSYSALAYKKDIQSTGMEIDQSKIIEVRNERSYCVIFFLFSLSLMMIFLQ